MKIVSFDIESTDLKANMGILLCAAFLPIVPEGYYSNHRNQPPKPYALKLERSEHNKHEPNPDKELAVAIRDELEKYDLAVTWNGKLFDVPFLNARLLYFRERRARLHWHLDLMYQARGSQNKIGRSALVSVQQYLGISEEEGKTALNWDVWKAAGLGDPKAMATVVDHCKRDTDVLAKAYWRFLEGVSRLERSM